MTFLLDAFSEDSTYSEPNLASLSRCRPRVSKRMGSPEPSSIFCHDRSGKSQFLGPLGLCSPWAAAYSLRRCISPSRSAPWSPEETLAYKTALLVFTGSSCTKMVPVGSCSTGLENLPLLKRRYAVLQSRPSFLAQSASVNTNVLSQSI